MYLAIMEHFYCYISRAAPAIHQLTGIPIPNPAMALLGKDKFMPIHKVKFEAVICHKVPVVEPCRHRIGIL